MNLQLNRGFIWNLAKRDFRSYFSSPTGYVFITLFILLSAAAAFWQERFFANNLANLDQLNGLFGYVLLFFIPALTMNSWAEERRRGTDELLLTLPATDLEIVLGKYIGVLGIYTASLILSLSHVIVLAWLGRPDVGLMFGNYVGYWLFGSALIALGMLASLLTANLTVGFILGALFCSFFVFIDSPAVVVSDTLRSRLGPVGAMGWFDDFAGGTISLAGVVYFLSLAGVMIYLNVFLLGRRHWPRSTGKESFLTHKMVRIAAVAVSIIGVTILAGRTGLRLDVTAEQIHSLSAETKQSIRNLPKDRPVLIQAYISPEVPRAYVELRSTLIGTLREIAAIGGSKVQVLIHDVEPFSTEAREAREKFGIGPREVMTTESARTGSAQVYLGLAFTSGAQEQIVPFFDRGLPVEYELVRSIRVVANAERRKVGVLCSAFKVFGGFDYETMNSQPPWSVVEELQKQYEVVQVTPTDSTMENVDALLAILPSALPQDEMDILQKYIRAGHPALLLDDPMPLADISQSPSVPAGAQMNPFQQRQQEQPKPKGEIRSFYKELGITWNPSQVIWDSYNPQRGLLQVPPEIVFVAPGNESGEAFNQENKATSGLQEVVLLYPGYMFKAVESKNTFTPLLRSSRVSGLLNWDQLVQRSFFGIGLNRNPRRVPSNDSYILAAQVSSPGSSDIDGQQGQAVNAIFVSDIDLISEQFFRIREQGIENLNFDNITFFLNCIDLLAGDNSFIDLRKKRVRYRTLESVENQTREYVERRLEDEKTAEAEAQKALSEAQGRLNQKVAELRGRTDLDAQAKEIMAQNLQEVENRRFEAAKTNIENTKQATIQRSKEMMEESVRTIQARIRTLAVLLPPVPVFCAGVVIFVKRRKREQEGAAAARRLRG